MWDEPNSHEGGIGGYARRLLERCLGALSGDEGDSVLAGEADGTVDADADAVGSAPSGVHRSEPESESDAGGAGWRSDPTYVERASVLDVLEANGGRLWQRELVELTDRPSSTISRWLCALEEADEVQRIQIGREKLVFLPGSRPQIAGTRLPEAVPGS
jgi:hypothetical protein